MKIRQSIDSEFYVNKFLDGVYEEKPLPMDIAKSVMKELQNRFIPYSYEDEYFNGGVEIFLYRVTNVIDRIGVGR